LDNGIGDTLVSPVLVSVSLSLVTGTEFQA